MYVGGNRNRESGTLVPKGFMAAFGIWVWMGSKSREREDIIIQLVPLASRNLRIGGRGRKEMR